MTRLDQGQLWFSAGRRRSPWRHEVHVGPAVVSTPRGRFQAIAESDGGATIACLAGRTRVVAGLREPVLLGPDQSAAVSSDGRTLVVMDRVSGSEVEGADLIDLTDAAMATEAEAEAAAEVPEMATVAAAAGAVAATGTMSGPRFPDLPDEEVAAPLDEPLPYADEPAGPARLGWIPELVAVAALVGLLVAAVWVFTRDAGEESERVSPTQAITDAVTAPETSPAITTTAPTTATTEAPTTAPTTSAPAPTASGASASGALSGCRRASGGVEATVDVQHRSGPASRFRVAATLVDPSGAVFARATVDTDLVQPGESIEAVVFVPVDGSVSGSCELAGVTAL